MGWGTVAAVAIPAIASYFGQKSANAANTQNVQSTNETQIDLANTQFQRRVKDLSAAGLNPALAYNQGGAAVPQLTAPQVQNELSGAAQAGTSGYSAYKAGELMSAQVDTQKSQETLNQMLAYKAAADAKVSMASASEIQARTPIYGSQIKEILQRIDNIAASTRLTNQQVVLAKQKAIIGILEGGQIEANTHNTEVDSVLKQVQTDIAKNQLRMSDVSANAAESPLGRYVMPFLPFGNTTAGAVAAGGTVNRTYVKSK